MPQFALRLSPLSACTSRRRLVLLVLGVLLATPAAMAEILYVTDILRLGLHNQSDTSDQAFRFLISGDSLDVLERSPYYARVRTTDGDEGWVKLSYLVEEKPARTELTDLTNERDRLSSELASLRTRLGERDTELQGLRSDRDNLEGSANTAATELATLRLENQTLSEKVAAYRFSVQMRWLLLAAALTLIGGFVGGWLWSDKKLRARHGGFRI